MISMQYSFTFPADYDMNIIRDRVKNKGSAFDNYEKLIFKAFLIAIKSDDTTKSKENIYAPFYLWKETQGMTNFLVSDGFQGVVNSFGAPSVHNWSCILEHTVSDKIQIAKYATKQIETITPYIDFKELQKQEKEFMQSVLQKGALAVVCAFEPKSWILVRFCLWEKPEQDMISKSTQSYHVLHVSYPDVYKENRAVSHDGHHRHRG